MDGYIAMARVSGGRVRALAWEGPPPDVVLGDDPLDVASRGAVLEDAWVDALAERLGRIRDAWSMTTFFLTDPNSWR